MTLRCCTQNVRIYYKMEPIGITESCIRPNHIRGSGKAAFLVSAFICDVRAQSEKSVDVRYIHDKIRMLECLNALLC